MRFVLAIAALVLAAVMIVLGVAQRTVFLGPSNLVVKTTVDDSLPYTVIDGSVLAAYPGQQSLTVSGADTVFIGYGRTADVTSWLGESKYSNVELDTTTNELSSSAVTPTDEGQDGNPIPDPTPEQLASLADPRGSDLWLAEQSEDRAAVVTINVPDDISVIIASDGTAAAPDKIQLSWPVNNATPWAGPLIVLGIALLITGIVLYLLGLRHMKRSRGPRRKSITAGPGLDQSPKAQSVLGRGRPKKQLTSKRSGRQNRLALIPIVLVSGLALSGCSAGYWPDLSSTPTPTPTPTSEADAVQAEQTDPPVVTVPQLRRIVARIATTTADADENLNVDLATTRFTGPALDERKANYTIRGKQADAALPTPIPGSPVELTLPQSTESWPRTVMTIVGDSTDQAVAPTALVLVQETPRSNYQVQYAVRLEPDAQTPQVAPATIGAPLVPPGLEFLLVAPDQVAVAYADLVTNGDQSQYAALFDAEGDTLRAAIAADREKKRGELPATASIEFAAEAGQGVPTALATNDSGGIVAVNIVERETVKPVEAGAQVKLSGQIAALSGLTETTKGIEASYSDQLLFYVPPVGSDEKIVLLGFSQALVAAKELP